MSLRGGNRSSLSFRHGSLYGSWREIPRGQGLLVKSLVSNAVDAIGTLRSSFTTDGISCLRNLGFGHYHKQVLIYF
jgi:hypothetical protein